MLPFKFDNLFQERIWGGTAMSTLLDKRLPPGKRIGESWELSVHRNAMSIVQKGPFQGYSFAEVVKKHPKEILGERLSQNFDAFPLLFKFIDANDKLSIQVHPDDANAKQHEKDLGKTEAWVVIHAKPGARMICGLKPGVGKREIEEGIRRNTLETLLNEFDIHAGEVVFVPAGSIHAIEEGTVIYEVQQASDITYRLYDWGRTDPAAGKPRALHVDASLRVINFSDIHDHRTCPVSLPCTAGKREILTACPYFILERFSLDEKLDRALDRFEVITVLSGSGNIYYKGGTEPLSRGETVLLPAALENCSIVPETHPLTLLSTRVPDDMASLKSGLLQEGVSAIQAAGLGGIA